jgi:acetyltransferase
MLDRGADFRLRNGRTVHVRAVRPADGEAVQDFVRGLSDTARRLRFFAPIRELTPSMLTRLTQVDGRRDRVLIALAGDDAGSQIVAIAQHAAEDDWRCELALVIADEWQELGLGRLLLDMLIENAREAGFARVGGDVLRSNDAILGLARAFGFAVTRSPHDATMVRITRDLDSSSPLLIEEGCLRSNRGGAQRASHSLNHPARFAGTLP